MDGEPLDLVGDILGDHFRVDEFAGEGLLSVVYKGRHLSVDATVAIKCLNLPPTLDAALAQPIVDNFKEGCRLHYQLARGNLNIAQTLASGTTIAPRTGASVPYLVREWFEGESLGRHLLRRREKQLTGRSLTETMRLLGGLADGLAYAHEQKIAHLSVHPSNVFLVRIGESTGSKVLDFGVGSAVDAAAAGVRNTLGAQILFPAYAAPEQLHRLLGETGPWTDVYALGLMVLETLSDRAVIEDHEVKATVDRVLDPNARPSARSHGVQVSDAVELVLERAFALDPSARYADVRQFWAALKAASSDVLKILPPFVAKKKKNQTVVERLRERRRRVAPQGVSAAHNSTSAAPLPKTSPSPANADTSPAKALAAPANAKGRPGEGPAKAVPPVKPGVVKTAAPSPAASKAPAGAEPKKESAASMAAFAPAKSVSTSKLAAASPAKAESRPKLDAATKADGIAEALGSTSTKPASIPKARAAPPVNAGVFGVARTKSATAIPSPSNVPETAKAEDPPKAEKRPSITEITEVRPVPEAPKLHMRRSSRPPAFALPRRNAPAFPKPTGDLTPRRLGVAPLPADLLASISDAGLAGPRDGTADRSPKGGVLLPAGADPSEAMALALEAALAAPPADDALKTVRAPPLVADAVDDGWEEEPAPITPNISASSEARLVASISAPPSKPLMEASQKAAELPEPVVADLISDPPMPLFPGGVPAATSDAALVLALPPPRKPMATAPALLGAMRDEPSLVLPRSNGPLYGVLAFSAAIALGILTLVAVRLSSHAPAGGTPAPSSTVGAFTRPPPQATGGGIPQATAVPRLVDSRTVDAPAPSAVPRRPFNPYKAKLALDKVAKDLRGCRTPEGIWGTGGATVYFAADGSVDRVALGPPYRGAPAGACVTEKLKTATVAPFDGPPQPVIFMFMVPLKVPAP